jgi:hypothetical protein
MLLLSQCTPIPVREKLKSELVRIESLGMLAKVTEPTPWVSQLVIAHKKSGDLRICVDPKELDKALIKERYTMPVLEEHVFEMGKSRFFTKAYLSSRGLTRSLVSLQPSRRVMDAIAGFVSEHSSENC